MNPKENSIPNSLRLYPSQQHLTPEQEAEARRFVAERLAARLSTEPVDEAEIANWLHLACQRAELAPPQEIVWLDSPPQVLWLWSPPNLQQTVWYSVGEDVQSDRWARVKSMPVILEDDGFPSWGTSQSGQGWDRYGTPLWCPEPDLEVAEQVKETIWSIIWQSQWRQVEEQIGKRVVAEMGSHLPNVIWDCVASPSEMENLVTQAYQDARHLVFYGFFDRYLAANDFSAWTRFVEGVSGYWLSKLGALLIRRPQVLSLDAQSRLHNSAGKCIEYRDGWGFYAWHGVRVPKRVILAPEQLTREDFLKELNLEVRRVMQERMGERFVQELGGQIIESSSHGTLYEVPLPNDPERVARYIQVQDASTAHHHVLRVPPTIQTAAEAVAWSSNLSGEAYQPAYKT
jgi:hypothetical protein